jgi:tetratricopeptide (TPR) repeat protein
MRAMISETGDSAIEPQLRQMAALYSSGQVEAAGRIGQQIIQQCPENIQALQLLGIIALTTRRADRAAEFFSRAIRQVPATAEAHYHLGAAFRELSQLEAAAASFERAILLRPDYAEAHFSRGITLRELGRPQAALACFDELIRLRPCDAVAHNARAAVLIDLQRSQQALESCDRALALAPQFASAFGNRAAALKQLKRPEEALASSEQAIALQPDHLVAHINRAAVLREQQRPEEALAAYERALSLHPRVADLYCHRAEVLQDLRRPDLALASCDQALALEPGSALAYLNRGSALHDLGHLDEALGCYVRAQQLKPQLDRAYANAALVHLLLGRFESGWQLFERRKKPGPGRGRSSWPAPLWSGEQSLAAKTLFIYWEQGLGDSVQFCRYAKLAADRGAQVIFSVQNSLHQLMLGLDQRIQFTRQDQMPASIDYHCPLMSLPRAFGSTLSAIPSEVPYLRGEPARVESWRRRIGSTGFRIGICWQGNPHRSIDAGRSYPLRELAGLAALPSVRLISLQKGPGSNQLADLPRGMAVEDLGADFDAGPSAFLDCAAVMETLDLIITCDTSVAHLAGALGRPTWIVLRHTPDWRWLLARDDSPWYPSARLFRQCHRGDWSAVFEEIQRELEQMLPG